MSRDTDMVIGLIKTIVWLLIALAVIGWLKNIVKFSDCDFVAPYKCEVVHGIGIVPVVGAFTGWMDIEDGDENK